MQPEDLLRIGHIRDQAADNERWIQGRDMKAFMADDLLQAAVAFAVQVVGEAVANLSDGFKAKFPETPWRKITAMRNRIVHGHYMIDHTLVWEAATAHLPQLAAQLLPFAPAEEE